MHLEIVNDIRTSRYDSLFGTYLVVFRGKVRAFLVDQLDLDMHQSVLGHSDVSINVRLR